VEKTAIKQYQYKKWYVYHNARKESRQKWCYLSKNNLEQPEIKEAINQYTTQNISHEFLSLHKK